MQKIIALILSTLLVVTTAFSQSREEFNGPFASWANVKTRFKAKGDGVTDDTRSLQMAIDSLSCTSIGFNKETSTAYTCIYIPRGHYKVSQTLNLRGKIGVNIIGEDPANTFIEWAGNDKDTMLLANGSACYKIARLTFDAKNKKEIEGIGIHWLQKWTEPKNRSYASSNIEIADCIFSGNMAVGIGGGYNWNDSEVKINRCSFNACSVAGIRITGYNALDYWIWYCKFYNCNRGIINVSGNFHAYSCYFKQSAYADVESDKGYYTSLRGCFSDNSGSLQYDKGSSNNPFKRVFQNNVVVAPQTTPVQYGHAGKLTFLNNQFDGVLIKQPPTAATGDKPYLVYYAGWFGTNYNVLSIGNKYIYDQPFALSVKYPKKIYGLNDSYGKKALPKGSDFVAKMPVTPALTKRKVFEVPVNADVKTMQAVINNAAKLQGQRPIVHFPVGQYLIDQPLVIPSGSDMQIIGDGFIYASVINAKKPFTGSSLIKVKGPSYIEIKDIQIGSGVIKPLNGIEFENIDQPSSNVHIDQIYSLADTSLFVNGFNYTAFEKNNSFFSDGNVIVGGSKQKAGTGTLQVYCFGGQFKGTSVYNNGVFVAKDCWWEGPSRVPLDLQGDGSITIDGAMMAPAKVDSLPSIKIGKFSGKLNFLNMYIQGGVSIEANNPDLNLLFWNINFFHKLNVLNAIPAKFSGKLAFAGINAQCFDQKNPLCKDVQTLNDKFVNVSDENKYFNDQTMQDRMSMPAGYQNLGAGVSNIYIGRVSLDGSMVGLKFSK
ncbi:glycosyl hydrolase family 28-related protein [Pinibacter aurantiacus]|uniref:Rhamnogalacturonase A/B/Epimerase-like pectate lyase domain-containing protein n=1 Tax=Pinibacter aurantiacus TaxID=2851599 RepID=A0A9E2S8I4_9BACT|nr:glycosyl hydrolase family 28-related protein [Pinibacter aurantiacus]MBV4357851.1 hypothetical protein [Pinibacter aurantiacus]